MKAVYAIQPYHVGSKSAKSLALVIPSEIAKKYHIDTSTIFALRGNDLTKSITLQSIQSLSDGLLKSARSDGDMRASSASKKCSDLT